MGHGITSSDNFVANGYKGGKVGKPAWHGLGICVEGVKSGAELLAIGKLNWKVRQLPLVGVDEMVTDQDGNTYQDTHTVDSHVLNIRSDNLAPLGVVGAGYKPFHNHELIELVESLGGEGAEIETIGSIKGGRRVWTLSRLDTFAVRPQDETAVYLACCAGHDGSLAVNLFHTSVRIVCQNTFRQAMTAGSKAKNSIVIRHEGDLQDKLQEAKHALKLVRETAKVEHQEALALDAKSMSREALQRFFLEVYTSIENPIVANPKTEEQVRSVQKAQSVIADWSQKFDADRRRTSGAASAWTAFNAVTEWLDHDRMVKGKDDSDRRENRIYSNLFGASYEKKSAVRNMALALV